MGLGKQSGIQNSKRNNYKVKISKSIKKIENI